MTGPGSPPSALQLGKVDDALLADPSRVKSGSRNDAIKTTLLLCDIADLPIGYVTWSPGDPTDHPPPAESA